MVERRKFRTPFKVIQRNLGWEIVASDGTPVALVFAEPYANFLCFAANMHDRLIEAFHLCRGHVNGTTIQPGNVPLKNLHDLLTDIAADISKHGR